MVMYAKVINGELKPAPKEFVENGKHIRGFTGEFLMERGYKQVLFTDPQSETAIPVYTDNGNEIVQSWTELTP